MKLKTGVLVLSFLILASMSCSKKTVVRRYYVIELPAVAMKTFSDSIRFNYRVDVRDFRIAGAFNQTRIALRTGTNELDYYFYHHWAVRPSNAVADFIYDLLVQKQMFTRVSREISYNPDYWISGDIKSIERMLVDKESYAHIHLVIDFIDARAEETVVHFEEDQTALLESDNSMNTFARKISEILANMTDSFLQRVSEYLANQPEK